jgi:2-polyprenyl-3-methyl-5-hydroxy-6-metoxy-1,4-benzoquinol methylase
MSGFPWTKQFVACNLCAADDGETLFAHDQHGLGLRTVVCRRCGLIYLNPRPTAADYDRFYRHWYHRLYPSRAAFHAGALGSRIVAEAARLRLEAYGKYFCGAVDMLEVGCGEGAFLKTLRDSRQDWAVQGIDLAPAEVAACREKGLQVTCGRLEDFSNAPHTHVAAFHVFEHALDPSAMLKEMASRIVCDGYLFLEVPNIQGSWRGLGMIHVAHPYQFAPSTLTAMVEKAGLSVVHCEEIETPLMPSSLRLIARNRAPASTLAVPDKLPIAEVQTIFRRKLAHWRRDWARNWLLRHGPLGVNEGLRNWLWEQTAGRRWQHRLLSAVDACRLQP